MIISRCNGWDPINTSKSSGSVPPYSWSQGESQGQSRSVLHQITQSSGIRNNSSSYQSCMPHNT